MSALKVGTKFLLETAQSVLVYDTLEEAKKDAKKYEQIEGIFEVVTRRVVDAKPKTK